MKRRFSLLTLCLIGPLTLGGCGTVSKLFGDDGPPKTELRSMKIVAFEDANQNMATEVDLVFVYQETLMALMPKKSPDWFRNKRELMLSGAGNLDVVSLEVPPNFVIDPVQLPERSRDAVLVTVYANYRALAGQAAVNLTALEGAVLRLKNKQLELGS